MAARIRTSPGKQEVRKSVHAFMVVWLIDRPRMENKECNVVVEDQRLGRGNFHRKTAAKRWDLRGLMEELW